MTRCHTFFALLAAGSLALAGPARAAAHDTATAQGGRPVLTRRAPAPPRAAAVAAPVVAAAAPTATPSTIAIAGTIISPAGQPRPGVCVFPTTNPRLIAVTDATGTFRLQVPATAGTLYLQADYVGLGSRRVAVDGQHPQPISLVLGD